jgi:hypothetical protein
VRNDIFTIQCFELVFAVQKFPQPTMNLYQQSHKIPSTNLPSTSINAHRPLWIDHHSFAASSLEKQESFDHEQHHKRVPPYPENRNPFHTPNDYDFPQQYEISKFQKQIPFVPCKVFHRRRGTSPNNITWLQAHLIFHAFLDLLQSPNPCMAEENPSCGHGRPASRLSASARLIS